MRYKMKKINKKINYIILVLAISCLFTGFLQGEQKSARELFNDAKLALFDRQWDIALDKLDLLSQAHPGNSYSTQVLFYKGRCYQEKKMAKEALENYNRFIKVTDNPTLKADAENSVIDLNASLYKKEKKTRYLQDIVALLKSKALEVRYYAAFKLSYVKDKTYAKKAVPVLNMMVELEDDEDLVDRARLAIMRIDPGLLKKDTGSRQIELRVLSIQVVDKSKGGKESFSISIPFGLANLALQSVPDDAKELLKEKGYNVNEILDIIVKSGGDVFKIESEDVIFRIWVK